MRPREMRTDGLATPLVGVCGYTRYIGCYFGGTTAVSHFVLTDILRHNSIGRFSAGANQILDGSCSPSKILSDGWFDEPASHTASMLASLPCLGASLH